MWALTSKAAYLLQHQVSGVCLAVPMTMHDVTVASSLTSQHAHSRQCANLGA